MSDQQSRAEYVPPEHDEREATRLRKAEMEARDKQLRAEVEALLAQRREERRGVLTAHAEDLRQQDKLFGAAMRADNGDNAELAFLRSEYERMSKRLAGQYHRDNIMRDINTARGMVQAGGSCEEIFRRVLDALEALADRSN